MEKHPDAYFSPHVVHREVLVWVLATRRQLDRWETLVASLLRSHLRGRREPSREVWEAQTERHLALVAAAHIRRAVGLPGWTGDIDTKVLDVLGDLRNTLEHWDENLPVFSISPKQDDPPRPSGRRLAEGQPEGFPFSMFAWNGTEGPVLWPGLPASTVREVLDRLEAHVLSQAKDLRRFVPAREPSPWLGESAGADRWWPKPDDGSRA